MSGLLRDRQGPAVPWTALSIPTFPVRTSTVALSLLLLCITGEVVADEALNGHVQSDIYKTSYVVDFSDYTAGPIQEWLASKGFEPQEGAKDPGNLELDASDDALVLRTKDPVLAFWMNQDIEVEKVSKIRIEWGVNKFPVGASYENGTNNEPIMVHVFFGEETMPSGSMFIEDRPYFIGIFLCEADRLNYPYIGRYFQEGARYVCVDRPEPNKTVVSEFDLAGAFRSYFGKDEVPPITAITISVDTSKSDDNGEATAFIKSIAFVG